MTPNAAPNELTVHIVDDDAAMRRSLVYLVESVGWRSEAFADGASFLAQAGPASAGCLLLDIRMPGMSGLEVQRELRARDCGLPVIFITAHGDIAMAVQAMKDGALDFVEKPFKDQQLLDAIARAMRETARRLARSSEQAAVRLRLEQLTPREREVAALVARGVSNKQIARELDISDKTVQAHRAHILEKLEVHSAAQLAQLLFRAEATDHPD